MDLNNQDLCLKTTCFCGCADIFRIPASSMLVEFTDGSWEVDDFRIASTMQPMSSFQCRILSYSAFGGAISG